MFNPASQPQNNAQQIAHERAVELAQADLTTIAILLDSPGWAYLKRRLTEIRASVRDTIADNEDLSDAQTRALRIQSAALLFLLRLPEYDRASHTATLAAHNNRKAGPSKG